MLEVLRSDDPEISMPPKGGPLFEDEIEIIEKWIAEGADWPGQMNDKIEKEPPTGPSFRLSVLKFLEQI